MLYLLTSMLTSPDGVPALRHATPHRIFYRPWVSHGCSRSCVPLHTIPWDPPAIGDGSHIKFPKHSPCTQHRSCRTLSGAERTQGAGIILREDDKTRQRQSSRQGFSSRDRSRHASVGVGNPSLSGVSYGRRQ